MGKVRIIGIILDVTTNINYSCNYIQIFLNISAI